MFLQTVVHIHGVWWVFVMSKVTLSSVTVPARRAGLKDKGGETVVLVFFPYLMYFCLHNYTNNSRNKISTFRDLEQDNFILPFQVSPMVDGATGAP